MALHYTTPLLNRSAMALHCSSSRSIAVMIQLTVHHRSFVRIHCTSLHHHEAGRSCHSSTWRLNGSSSIHPGSHDAPHRCSTNHQWLSIAPHHVTSLVIEYRWNPLWHRVSLSSCTQCLSESLCGIDGPDPHRLTLHHEATPRINYG